MILALTILMWEKLGKKEVTLTYAFAFTISMLYAFFTDFYIVLILGKIYSNQ